AAVDERRGADALPAGAYRAAGALRAAAAAVVRVGLRVKAIAAAKGPIGIAAARTILAIARPRAHVAAAVAVVAVPLRVDARAAAVDLAGRTGARAVRADLAAGAEVAAAVAVGCARARVDARAAAVGEVRPALERARARVANLVQAARDGARPAVVRVRRR